MDLIPRIVRAHQRRVAASIPDDIQRYLPQAGGLWWAFNNMATNFKDDLKKFGDKAKDILQANIVDAAKSLGEEYEKADDPGSKLDKARERLSKAQKEYEEAQEEVGELEQDHRGARTKARRLQGEILWNLRKESEEFIKALEAVPLERVEDQFTFDQARRRARNVWTSTDFRIG